MPLQLTVIHVRPDMAFNRIRNGRAPRLSRMMEGASDSIGQGMSPASWNS